MHRDDPSISRAEFDQSPADRQQRFIEAQGKPGFVPGIFLTLAHQLAEYRAFYVCFDSLTNLSTMHTNSYVLPDEQGARRKEDKRPAICIINVRIGYTYTQ